MKQGFGWKNSMRTLGLLLVLAAGFSVPASAQTVQFTDSFTRADSLTVGNGWVDAAGQYKIASNTLQTQSAQSGGLTTGVLLRPTSENLQDVEVDVKGEAWASSKDEIYKGLLRYQSGSGNRYEAEMDYGFGASGAAWAIKTNVSGSSSPWAGGTANGTFTPIATHLYTLKCKVTGVSPSTCVISVYDETAAATVAGTGGTFTDSTAGLQQAGQEGVQLGWYDQNSTHPSGTPILAAYTVYTFGAAPAATSYAQSLSATSGASGTPVTITYTPNGTTTAVVTPAVSGVSGAFSPTTVTLSGTTPVTTAFTPSSAGTATLSATNSGTLTNPVNLTYTVGGAAVYTLASSVLQGYFQKFATLLSGTAYAQWDSPGNYTLPFAFTGTSILVAFDTSPETGASVAAGNYPLLKYSLDNAPWVSYRLTSSLALTGLANTSHTLQIAYVLNNEGVDIWTTPVGVVRFTQITLDTGATLSAATIPAKTMCWHGDSTGRSAWNDYSGYTDADGTFTAGYLAAQGLGAFFGNCSFSHQGWNQGGAPGSNVPAFYTAGNNAATTYNQYVNGVYRTVGGSGTGLFSTDCDYHIICQGQNGSVTNAQVQSFLGSYRGNTNNYIFLLVPFSGANRAAITAGFNAYQSGTPDAKCFLIDLGADSYYFPAPSKFSGDGVHPNQWTHAQFAAMLVKAIQAKIGGTSVIRRRVQ